jgi:N-acyl-D-amino-acid deacylase
MTGSRPPVSGPKGGGGVAGAYADLCVFDADRVIDRAILAEPTQPAAGIEHVFVNGRPVWSESRPTGERPGRALRREAMQRAN